MKRLRVLAQLTVAGVREGGAIAWLFALAVAERPRTWLRRRRGLDPRLIWGPVPLISLKYWSEAMRGAGYSSMTCVNTVYSIYRREDFDVYLERFEREGRSAALSRYRFFAWTLRRGDLFFRFLDGGFLRHTRLEWWECRLLKLAGKRLIVSPYGGDIAVKGHLQGLEEDLYADYPYLRDQSDEIKRWVDHTVGHADLVIMNWQIGYLPRHDVVWLSQLAIDLDQWPRSDADSRADGRNGAVSVLHAPNHRHIKGTALLERAVEVLRGEGLEIELRLLEGVPNEELRAAMASADVVADQFLLPGYAMTAVEAMSLARPVMNNMSGLPEEVQRTEAFKQWPAVDSGAGAVTDQLRRLAQDPALRRELGEAGRGFVERFHSYEGVARGWTQIIDHLWRGAPLPDSLPSGGDPQALGDLHLRQAPS